MKTDDLIAMLSTGSGAVEPHAVFRRYSTAIGWGALCAMLLMAMLLGVRHDLGQALSQPMFWVKVGFVISLAAASLYSVSRLSRPGSGLATAIVALAVPILFIWTVAAIALSNAVPTEREDLLFGRTWSSCPFLIATLSVPIFVALAWAMKGLAPTQLRLAGAIVGFAAGAIGAAVYALHCPEMGAPFLASWYLLGMLIPTAVGTLLGPRLFRW